MSVEGGWGSGEGACGLLYGPVLSPPLRRSPVKIVLLTDDSIRLEPEAGAMTIEAPSADRTYSPFHMLASGLAVCTFSILHSWAETVGLSADDLAIEVAWTFAEEPHRVGELALTLDWPSLPPQRTRTAYRVAELCPIHHTITGGAAVRIERAAASGEARLEAPHEVGAGHAHGHAGEHGHEHRHEHRHEHGHAHTH